MFQHMFQRKCSGYAVLIGSNPGRSGYSVRRKIRRRLELALASVGSMLKYMLKCSQTSPCILIVICNTRHKH